MRQRLFYGLLGLSGTILWFGMSISFAQSIVNTAAIQYSSDGKYVAATGNVSYNYFSVWEVETGDPVVDIYPYIDVDTYISDMTWSPESDLVAILTDDQFVRVWNLDGVMVGEFQPLGRLNFPTAIEWSPDGNFLAIAGNIQSQIHFWDANNYFPVTRTGGSLDVTHMAWNPQHEIIATIFDHGTEPEPYIPFVMPAIGAENGAYVLCPDACAKDFARTLDWSHDGETLAIGYAGVSVQGVKRIEIEAVFYSS
ncbi:MAG: WD40 repeat domain-containing protein, partial [Chloroflexota bacterium]